MFFIFTYFIGAVYNAVVECKTNSIYQYISLVSSNLKSSSPFKAKLLFSVRNYTGHMSGSQKNFRYKFPPPPPDSLSF